MECLDIDLLCQLVSVDTSNDSTTKAVSIIDDLLRGAGYQVAVFGREENLGLLAKNTLALEYDRLGLRYMVFAGHLDTVPHGDGGWLTAPFEATRIGDRLYGLGVADMKGSVACIVQTLLRLSESGGVPVGALFTFSEETGLVGMRSFFEQDAHSLSAGTVVLLGEPTNMRLGVAHKGFLDFELSFTGRGGHSSDIAGVSNPIYDAAKFALKVEAFASAWFDEARRPFETGPALNLSRFQSGRITGVIPEEAVISGELRHIADEDRERLYGFIGEQADIRVLHEFAPFVTGLSDDEIFDFCRAASLETSTVGYLTEASVLAEHGFPTLICGPGDIKYCHQPNEWVELAELEEACGTFQTLAVTCAGQGRGGAHAIQ